jgi:hypothetical protein
MLPAGRLNVRDKMRSLIFSKLILSAAIGSWITQPLTEMSSRDKNKKYFWVRERARCVRPTTSPSSVSLISR